MSVKCRCGGEYKTTGNVIKNEYQYLCDKCYEMIWLKQLEDEGEIMSKKSNPPVAEKLKALNECGINEIHEAITFVDGKLTIQFQVGHPDEEGAVKGCFPTHAIDAIVKLHEHYQTIFPSRETALCITKLQEARMWLDERARDRKERGVLQTDKK
jgi:hypothetical protein